MAHKRPRRAANGQSLPREEGGSLHDRDGNLPNLMPHVRPSSKENLERERTSPFIRASIRTWLATKPSLPVCMRHAVLLRSCHFHVLRLASVSSRLILFSVLRHTDHQRRADGIQTAESLFISIISCRLNTIRPLNPRRRIAGELTFLMPPSSILPLHLSSTREILSPSV